MSQFNENHRYSVSIETSNNSYTYNSAATKREALTMASNLRRWGLGMFSSLTKAERADALVVIHDAKKETDFYHLGFVKSQLK